MTSGDNSSLNIDLSTGTDIPFEKVFVSSAPLNALLIEGLYESLAWKNIYEDYEGTDGYFNMDNADTSEYEDKAMTLIKNYEKQKGNIQYNITPSSIMIYKLADKNIMGDGNETTITVNMVDHIEDIAIYKRYLTDTSIFENDNLGYKDLVVLTDSVEDGGYVTYISHGKLSSNIFMEEVMYWNGYMTDVNIKNVKSYIEKLSEAQKQQLKSQDFGNQGVFYQRDYWVNDIDEKYYEISVHSYQTTCSSEYFEEDAFKDYINMHNAPRPESGMNTFTEYGKEKYPNLNISDMGEKKYYISKSGEFLGNTEAEAKSKTNQETTIEASPVVETPIYEEPQNTVEETQTNEVESREQEGAENNTALENVTTENVE